MSRPELTKALSAQDFLDYYWLKSELLAFCRTNRLPVTGSKVELTKQISHFLRTGENLAQAKPRQFKATMPNTFTRNTIIEAGWRCTQELRQFFEQEIGSAFHFNSFMRDYLTQSGVGQTLDTAIKGWHESKSKPKGSSEITKQFEYNQFTRNYYMANPAAKREDVIRAWKVERSKRASEK